MEFKKGVLAKDDQVLIVSAFFRPLVAVLFIDHG